VHFDGHHELVRRGLRHHRWFQRDPERLQPTETPAVFNVSTFSSSATSPRRGSRVTRSPPLQAEIDLGTEIVDLSDVGVHVRVLRGTLDIVGLQKSGPPCRTTPASSRP